MKIICEHCGTNIDLDKDKVCPNCKAPYSKNQDYKEYKERLNKEKDTDLRSKELDNELKEKTKDIMDTSLRTFKSTFTKSSSSSTFISPVATFKIVSSKSGKALVLIPFSFKKTYVALIAVRLFPSRKTWPRAIAMQYMAAKAKTLSTPS